MINHARTLLLNQPGKAYMPGMFGEEYVPPHYTPVSFPSYIITPHKILFGTSPDRAFLNFRAVELLNLIHVTELAEFIYDLDARVTYWPQQQTEFFTKANTGIALKKISGYDKSRAYLKGKPKADNSRGRAYTEYFLQLTKIGDATSLEISGDNLVTPAVTVVEPETELSNFSRWLPLPDKQLDIQFSDIGSITSSSYLLLEEAPQPLLTENYETIMLDVGEMLPFTLRPKMGIQANSTVIGQWQLQVYSRPDDAIKICMPKLSMLGEPLFLELFGVRNDIQPYATFKSIWFDHPLPNYRLAAFVLAMIYRADEVRNK